MEKNTVETTTRMWTKEDLKMKKAEQKQLEKEADKIIEKLQDGMQIL